MDFRVTEMQKTHKMAGDAGSTPERATGQPMGPRATRHVRRRRVLGVAVAAPAALTAAALTPVGAHAQTPPQGQGTTSGAAPGTAQTSPAASARPGLKAVSIFAGERKARGTLDFPMAVAVDTAGNVYAADVDNHRIQKFAPDGRVLAVWGGGSGGSTPSDRPGQFTSPMGIALDEAGNVYVADTGNHRIQKLAPDGSVAAVWGRRGTGPGEFNEPAGVAVLPSGMVAVTERINNRVQLLRPDGTAEAVWARAGTRAFARPVGVAAQQVGGATVLLVAEVDGHRIRQVGLDGSELAVWGRAGLNLGQFRWPSGVAVDTIGNVYVADTGNSRIQKLTSNGIPVDQWSIVQPDPLPGQTIDFLTRRMFFSLPRGVAVDARGTLYVADSANHRIVSLNGVGRLRRDWGTPPDMPGLFQSPSSVVVDGTGTVYVSDPTTARVTRFSADGRLESAWSLPVETLSVRGRRVLYQPRPGPMALAKDGALYVADIGALPAIYKVSVSGTVQARWMVGTERDEVVINALTVSPSGEIWAMDRADALVWRVSPEGRTLGSWGRRGSLPGQLRSPNSIVATPAGEAVVLDSGNVRVQRYDATGGLLGSWVPVIPGTGAVTGLVQLAIDRAGNLLIAESGPLGRVSRFTLDGGFLETLITGVSEPLGATRIAGLAADLQGRTLAVDVGAAHVLVIS